MLMMPLICADHWTLLVVERAGMARRAAEPIEMPMDTTNCCSKCRNTSGCNQYGAWAALKYNARVDHELEFINPLEKLALLPNSEQWAVRYYDSLRAPSRTCAARAVALLEAHQSVCVKSHAAPKELDTARANRALQDDSTSCGWWALCCVESEMRRYLGEGQWPIGFNLPVHTAGLRQICENMLRGRVPG